MKLCEKCETRNLDIAKYCSGCGYELPKQEVVEEQNIQQTPKKQKIDTTQITKIVGGTIVGVITAIIIQYFLLPKLLSPSIDKDLMHAASEINKTCPIMVDAETRFDNAVALPKIFQYNYTLINLEKSMIDTLQIKNYIEPNIVNFIRTSPQMQFARDKKVAINYCYRDTNGEYLFMISVTKKQYE